MDDTERDLLAATLHKTMTTVPGPALDAALMELGWPQLLAESPAIAVPMVFRLLGETGAQAPLLNDVLLDAAGRPPGGTLPLPYAGGSWVIWKRTEQTEPPGAVVSSTVLDGGLPLCPVPPGDAPDGGRGDGPPLAAGRRALGWWLVGTGRAMLTLAQCHALDRVQFGRPLAAFQAVRHRLAETLVALDGAEAALRTAGAAGAAGAADDDLGSLLAKAAAGRAALIAARHCQQVLGGIGFTAEHDLHRHVRRALVLDGLLGSSRELTREAGALLRAECSAPRLASL